MVSRTKRLLALAVLSALGLSGAAWGQAGPTTAGGKMYTNKQQFRLPFNLEKEDRQRLREVQLYVKGPNEAWSCKETTAPTQSHFTFRAPQDGEYLFNIVTVDRNGRATPADVTQETPALVVVVDTTPPDVFVTVPQPAARASGDDVVRIAVRDANPDPKQPIKAEYQTPDQKWQPLASAGSPDRFRCPAGADWNGLVRVTVLDSAGNSTVREVGGAVPAPSTGEAPHPVAELDAPPRPGAPALPPVPAPTTAMAPSPLGTPFPPPPVQTTSLRPTAPTPPSPPSPVPAPLPAAPSSPITPVSYAPPAGPAHDTPAHEIPAGQRAVVSGLVTQLAYQVEPVGASGVGKVEVWLTPDEGKTWQKACEDTDKTSPVEVRLPGEGIYGLTVVVSNGNGVGDPPPTRGTAPDWLVEVDTTKPSAQLLTVRQGQGDEASYLMVNWAASDKNFGPEPVDLYFAVQKDGPWQPIARGLKNDGHYRWAVPHEVGPEFYVRLDVSDRAGNTTRCDSPQSVVMDLTKPRARVLGVTSNASRNGATPPTGN